ncbi:MAG: lipocalin-like domain-containing protein [Parabacteroides sp.]
MHKLFKALFFYSGLLSLIACGDSLEHHLEGKWQLKTVEQNGKIEIVDTVWYNFQNSLFEYQVYVPAIDSVRNMYGYKTLADDLHLELELVSYFITIKDFLPLTDWSSPKRTFQIEESSSNLLILSSEGKTYKFEKY